MSVEVFRKWSPLDRIISKPLSTTLAALGSEMGLAPHCATQHGNVTTHKEREGTSSLEAAEAASSFMPSFLEHLRRLLDVKSALRKSCLVHYKLALPAPQLSSPAIAA